MFWIVRIWQTNYKNKEGDLETYIALNSIFRSYKSNNFGGRYLTFKVKEEITEVESRKKTSNYVHYLLFWCTEADAYHLKETWEGVYQKNKLKYNKRSQPSFRVYIKFYNFSEIPNPGNKFYHIDQYNKSSIFYDNSDCTIIYRIPSVNLEIISSIINTSIYTINNKSLIYSIPRKKFQGQFYLLP